MTTTALDYEGVVVDVLDPADTKAAAAGFARDAAALEKAATEDDITVSGGGMKPVSLSSPLARMVAGVLRELSEGHTVAVMSTAEEVSTGVAARMLGVSRPHVAKLVDAGRLQGRRVNKHRRVRLASVLAFKREMERRNAVLDELAELSQEMGLYDILEPERSNG
jgi:excisionase family DNA binding protein